MSMLSGGCCCRGHVVCSGGPVAPVRVGGSIHSRFLMNVYTDTGRKCWAGLVRGWAHKALRNWLLGVLEIFLPDKIYTQDSGIEWYRYRSAYIHFAACAGLNVPDFLRAWACHTLDPTTPLPRR